METKAKATAIEENRREKCTHTDTHTQIVKCAATKRTFRCVFVDVCICV